MCEHEYLTLLLASADPSSEPKRRHEENPVSRATEKICSKSI